MADRGSSVALNATLTDTTLDNDPTVSIKAELTASMNTDPNADALINLITVVIQELESLIGTQGGELGTVDVSHLLRIVLMRILALPDVPDSIKDDEESLESDGCKGALKNLSILWIVEILVERQALAEFINLKAFYVEFVVAESLIRSRNWL